MLQGRGLYGKNGALKFLSDILKQMFAFDKVLSIVLFDS